MSQKAVRRNGIKRTPAPEPKKESIFDYLKTGSVGSPQSSNRSARPHGGNAVAATRSSRVPSSMYRSRRDAWTSTCVGTAARPTKSKPSY